MRAQSGIQHKGEEITWISEQPSAVCCSERESNREEQEEEERESRVSRALLCSRNQGPYLCPGELLIKGDKGRAQQVINALSVSLPMFCRSGASQEESKAGGEYYDLLLLCVCAY